MGTNAIIVWAHTQASDDNAFSSALINAVIIHNVCYFGLNRACACAGKARKVAPSSPFRPAAPLKWMPMNEVDNVEWESVIDALDPKHFYFSYLTHDPSSFDLKLS